jgi:hypothetical protein
MKGQGMPRLNLYAELTTKDDPRLRMDELIQNSLLRHAAAIENALAERLRAAIALHTDPQTANTIFQSVMFVLTNTVVAYEEPHIRD